MESLKLHITENVINGRSLSEYESTLNFRREHLRDKKVLVFGCGGSHIGKELAEGEISVEVVNMDILPNPHTLHDHTFSINRLLWRRRLMEQKIFEYEVGQIVFPVVEEIDNQLTGIEGRVFVQYNKNPLSFKDEYFDYVFLSWVFHQIPYDEQMSVLKELMRVSKRIHIAPVGYEEAIAIEDALIGAPFTIAAVEDFDIDDSIQFSRTKSLHAVPMLDVDYSQRPFSVNSYNSARVILKRITLDSNKNAL